MNRTLVGALALCALGLSACTNGSGPVADPPVTVAPSSIVVGPQLVVTRADTGDVVSVFPTFLPAGGGAPSAAWSPDGERLLLGDGRGYYVVRPSLRPGVSHSVLGNEPAVAVAWGADGRMAVALADGRLRVLDRDGATLDERAVGVVHALAWSDDGRLGFVVDAEAAVGIWTGPDSDVWRSDAVLPTDRHGVDLAWLPDSRLAVLVRGNDPLQELVVLNPGTERAAEKRIAVDAYAGEEQRLGLITSDLRTVVVDRVTGFGSDARPVGQELETRGLDLDTRETTFEREGELVIPPGTVVAGAEVFVLGGSCSSSEVLYRVEAASGRAEAIWTGAVETHVLGAWLSPLERERVLIRTPAGAFVVSATGEPRQLASRERIVGVADGDGWSPDGRRVAHWESPDLPFGWCGG